MGVSDGIPREDELSGEIYPDCGQHHPTGLGPRCDKGTKRRPAQCQFALSFASYLLTENPLMQAPTSTMFFPSTRSQVTVEGTL